MIYRPAFLPRNSPAVLHVQLPQSSGFFGNVASSIALRQALRIPTCCRRYDCWNQSNIEVVHGENKQENRRLRKISKMLCYLCNTSGRLRRRAERSPGHASDAGASFRCLLTFLDPIEPFASGIINKCVLPGASTWRAEDLDEALEGCGCLCWYAWSNLEMQLPDTAQPQLRMPAPLIRHSLEEDGV